MIYLCRLEVTAVAKKTAFKFPAVFDHCLLMNINELCTDSLLINNDQEMAQSEKFPVQKPRRGKKQIENQVQIQKEHM